MFKASFYFNVVFFYSVSWPEKRYIIFECMPIPCSFGHVFKVLSYKSDVGFNTHVFFVVVVVEGFETTVNVANAFGENGLVNREICV